MRGQNLFLSETKRIREGKPNLPHKPGGGQNLCCFTQKREDQLSGGFIHHFEPRRISALKIFLLGGKGFSVQAQEIHRLWIIGKKDPFRTRIPEREFLKRVPNANRLCFFKGAHPDAFFPHPRFHWQRILPVNVVCLEMNMVAPSTTYYILQHAIFLNYLIGGMMPFKRN